MMFACRKRLEKIFQKLIEDRSGNLMLVFALALLPIFLGLGSAVDFNRAVHMKGMMQSAADASVLSAVLMAEDGATETFALDMFRTQFELSDNKSFSAMPAADASMAEEILTLRAHADVRTTVMGLVQESVPVDVLARAMRVEGGPACLVSLDPTAEKALNLSGTAQINAVGCGIQVNSNDPQSITQKGNAAANVPHICTRGRYTGSFSTKPRRCPALKDPLEAAVVDDIAETMPASCKSGNIQIKKTHKTLQPGCYAGTINVMSHGSLHLAPGLYFIEDGDFIVRSGATVTGDGVTIIFVGSQAGGVTIRSGSYVELSATTEGPFAGLLFVQDPNATPRDDESILIGGGDLELTGTIYLPLHQLTITGNGSISGASPQFAIIAKTLSLEGNGVLNINMNTNYAKAGYSQLPGVKSWPGAILIE